MSCRAFRTPYLRLPRIHRIVLVTGRQSRYERLRPVGFGSITTNADDMRTGPDQRGRFNPNRRFQPPQQRGPQRNQTFESNGTGVKIRGSARQIFERYVALAREAATSGDLIAAENFYQHAEHYFRVASANREGAQQRTGLPPQPITSTEVATNGAEERRDDTAGDRSEPGWGSDHPGFI